MPNNRPVGFARGLGVNLGWFLNKNKAHQITSEAFAAVDKGFWPRTGEDGAARDSATASSI